MPRVRIPDASLVVCTDSVLLPFLAPRVFTQPSISTRKKVQNRNSGGTLSKGENGNVATKTTPLAWAQDSNCSKQQRVKAGAILPIHSPHIRRNGLQTKNGIDNLRHTYSNISQFTRQHAKSYSTVNDDGRVPARKARSRRQKSTKGTTNKTKSSQRIIRRLRGKAPASTLAKRGPLQAEKRKHALEEQLASLKKYLTRLPPDIPFQDLMRRGHYRSLRRRLFNLRNWNVIQLDLSRKGVTATSVASLIPAFAFLDRNVYPGFQRYGRKGGIKHNPRCGRLSKTLFSHPEPSLARVQKIWLDMDPNARKQWYARLLFYLLDRKPGRALPFIQILAADPDLRDVSAKAIADALEHLSRIHRRGEYPASHSWDKDAHVNKKAFLPAFTHIFRTFLVEKHDVLTQDFLYNLVAFSTLEDLKKMLDCVIDYRGKIKFDTLLHYANAFGQAGDIQNALRCLDEIKRRHSPEQWVEVSQRKKLRWSCALILRKGMSKGENYHGMPEIVAHMLNLGVKMDTLLYNVVISNAMEAGDHSTAFKVYNALEGNGLKPDKVTYSVLLYGCTLQPNPAIFQDFAQQCAVAAKEMKDSWLATDVLYYVYIRHQNDPEPRRSDLIWQTYLNFFSVEPLKPFLTQHRHLWLDAIERQQSLPESGILEPTTNALYLVLQTEIKQALGVSDQRVLSLYQQFKYFAPSPGLQPLSRSPQIWNAFLHAFCLKQQFASASQVIKDMTDNNPQPNIFTWNIFMQAFFKTGQVQVAERVFELARNRGIEPDQYTYGVLMRGYAKAQLVDRIGETLKFVDSKTEMDPDLLRALTKVVNRRRLMLTLEKSRINKEAREKAELEKYSKEERARWGMVDPFAKETGPLSEEMLSKKEESTEALLGTVETLQEPATTSNEPPSVDQDATTAHYNASSLASTIPQTPLPLAPPTQPNSSPAPTPRSGNVPSQPRIRTSASSTPLAHLKNPQPTIPTSNLPLSLTPTLMPAQLRHLPHNDPEVEYRKLQERLGILAPSTLLTEEENEGKEENEKGKGIEGGELEFDSVFSNAKKKREELVRRINVVRRRKKGGK